MSPQLEAGIARLCDLNLTRPSTAYLREHDLDWHAIRAAAGGLFLTRIISHQEPWFEFHDRGHPAAIITALDEDAETPLDLLAWPLDDPDTVLHWMSPPAPVLGLQNLTNPASYARGRPCRVHRTPLAWCQSGCEGAVILDPRRAASQLEFLPGPIAPEDQQHLDWIARGIPSLQRLPRFALPTSRRRAA